MQTIEQTEPSSKTSPVKSCLATVFSILLGIWGVLTGISALYLAYVFIRSGMINPTTISIIVIGAASCVLILFTALRFNKQKWYLSLAVLILVWGVSAIFLAPLINRSSERLQMESLSMQTALAPGDYFFVDKLAYNSKLPQRGDVILFNPPLLGGTMIKRVIGLSGETVTIRSGQVYIDGVLLNEPGSIPQTNRGGEWHVGEAEYFVLGDNRNNSSDSRSWGFVPLEDILGKVTYIYFPFSRAGNVSNYDTAP